MFWGCGRLLFYARVKTEWRGQKGYCLFSKLNSQKVQLRVSKPRTINPLNDVLNHSKSILFLRKCMHARFKAPGSRRTFKTWTLKIDHMCFCFLTQRSLCLIHHDGAPCAVLRRPEALDCRVRIPPETCTAFTRDPPSRYRTPDLRIWEPTPNQLSYRHAYHLRSSAHTGGCEKNTPPEKRAHESISLKSTASGGGVGRTFCRCVAGPGLAERCVFYRRRYVCPPFRGPLIIGLYVYYMSLFSLIYTYKHFGK